jgi:YVTN family beta-propeller protein
LRLRTSSLVWVAASCVFAQDAPPKAPDFIQRRTEQKGLALDMFVQPLAPSADGKIHLRQGDPVSFRFRISDTASGAPIRNIQPAAWLEPRHPGEQRTSEGCIQKLKGFMGGGLSTAAETDLNVFYALTLNADPSISVVDPLFSFGGSKLLALVPLRSPGYDWVLGADRRKLFVAEPGANSVAVIDTSTWKVTADIEVSIRPTRLGMQPDQRFLWVANEASVPNAEDSGVTVINVATMKAAARIVTGPGEHEIAFSDDSRFAFVSNLAGGSVSVIDAQGLRKLEDIQTGPEPVSVAWSKKAGMLYVTHRADGSIVAIDPVRHKVSAPIPTAKGIGQIRFAPDGRLGFILHEARNEVYILDTASNKIVQIGDTKAQPNQVTFSDKLAFIRHRGSDQVQMITLAQAGVAGAKVGMTDFPGGEKAPGQMSLFTPADGIVEVPGGGEVLVSNALDKSVHLYKEGMAAPMGTFSNFGHEPRAVLALDRSLRESEPGTYETSTIFGRPGLYDVVFFSTNPQLVHCFELPVEANPEMPDPSNRGTQVELSSEFQKGEKTIREGDSVHYSFRLLDRANGKHREGVPDTQVSLCLASGTWCKRFPATDEGHPGTYSVELQPPSAATYTIWVQAPSAGLSLNNPYSVTLTVEPATRGKDQ